MEPKDAVNAPVWIDGLPMCGEDLRAWADQDAAMRGVWDVAVCPDCVGDCIQTQDGERHHIEMIYADGEVLLENGVTQERPEVYLRRCKP
jgi:hypothetical protein